jgi:hypothetical protein
MKTLHPEQGEDLFHLGWRGDAYYKRVGDGPLAGYAATYDLEKKKHWVGDVYFNFARLERHTPVLRWAACGITAKAEARGIDLSRFHFCGAPEGGKGLANQLASLHDGQWFFPEKIVTAEATAEGRAQSDMGWGRHEPDPDFPVAVVEDTSNNMSTPDKLEAILGDRLQVMLCVLNRSFGDKAVEESYTLKSGRTIPVIALVRKPIPQFKQDDPEVAELVKAGNVEWEMKKNWKRVVPYLATFVAP